MERNFILTISIFVLLFTFSTRSQDKSLREHYNNFVIIFRSIEAPGIEALNNLDYAYNNYFHSPGVLEKYSLEKGIEKCYDIFESISQKYYDLSIPNDYPENIRNYLLSAKERMSSIYYKRIEAISDLRKYLNSGGQDYTEGYKDKMDNAKSYYSQVTVNLFNSETEVRLLGDYSFSENNDLNKLQINETIDSVNTNINYFIYFLSKDGISSYNTRTKEMSTFVNCPNEFILSAKASSPSRSKIAIALIDKKNNTKIYVLDLLKTKYYFLKNNPGIKPINLVWKDDNFLFVNTYDEKNEYGRYIPENPWTELINIKKIKVVYSFRPTSGNILSTYLIDKNYLVYYSINAATVGDYTKDYYVINPVSNSQIGTGYQFNSNSQGQFVENKKLFIWEPVNVKDEYGRILSSSNQLSYLNYEKGSGRVIVYDRKEDPKEMTFYPQLRKITCIIDKDGYSNDQIITIYDTEKNISSFINEKGDFRNVTLSPSGNKLLFYNISEETIVIKNLSDNHSYNIYYRSNLEEWLDDNSIMLRSDINKTFRIYNLSVKSYIEFSFEDLNSNAIVIGYAQQ